MNNLSIASLIVVITLMLSCKPDSQNDFSSGIITDDSSHYNLGRKTVKMTFDTLSNVLKTKINEEGMEGAIGFCNIEALPLTTLFEDDLRVAIRRATSLTRNPKNAPTELEAEALNYYQRLRSEGTPLEDIVYQSRGGEAHYFKPIFIQPHCLSCHGNVTNQPYYKKIKELYPGDKAIDYQEGDLRGIWSVKFKN